MSLAWKSVHLECRRRPYLRAVAVGKCCGWFGNVHQHWRTAGMPHRLALFVQHVTLPSARVALRDGG